MKTVHRPQANTLCPGWVYLIRDIESGEYKVGLSCSPRSRLTNLLAVTKRPFEVVWTVATNDMGRLEYECKLAWQRWHLRGEWYALPGGEVDRFRRMVVLNWRSRPPISVQQVSCNPAVRPSSRRRDMRPGAIFA